VDCAGTIWPMSKNNKVKGTLLRGIGKQGMKQ
jgi:hypothetical protein